jgi:hypothetical protein
MRGSARAGTPGRRPPSSIRTSRGVGSSAARQRALPRLLKCFVRTFEGAPCLKYEAVGTTEVIVTSTGPLATAAVTVGTLSSGAVALCESISQMTRMEFLVGAHIRKGRNDRLAVHAAVGRPLGWRCTRDERPGPSRRARASERRHRKEVHRSLAYHMFIAYRGQHALCWAQNVRRDAI